VSDRDDDSRPLDPRLPLPHGDERPPSDAERAADEALGEALRSAYDPAPIDPKRHAELLEQALMDPFAPPTDEEVRESERLRQALETGDESHADVRLLRALSIAKEPSELPPEAVSAARARLHRTTPPKKTNVVFVSFGAAALALAAAFALLVGGGLATKPAPAAGRLLPSRTTTDLFERQFEPGETTERIDRIASSRAHDLRENRYAMWGAR
jgi:hypothetical protein